MILRKIAITVIALVVVPIFFGSSLLTMWASDRDVPVIVRSVWISPQAAKPCQPISIWVNRTMLRETGIHVERMLVDVTGEREPLASVDWRDNPGGLGDASYSTAEIVPCTFKPGWASYVSTTYYYRNPFHQYLWPIASGRRHVSFCVFTDDVPPEQACRKDEPPRLIE